MAGNMKVEIASIKILKYMQSSWNYKRTFVEAFVELWCAQRAWSLQKFDKPIMS